jgi:hypothetical protein
MIKKFFMLITFVHIPMQIICCQEKTIKNSNQTQGTTESYIPSNQDKEPFENKLFRIDKQLQTQKESYNLTKQIKNLEKDLLNIKHISHRNDVKEIEEAIKERKTWVESNKNQVLVDDETQQDDDLNSLKAKILVGGIIFAASAALVTALIKIKNSFKNS